MKIQSHHFTMHLLLLLKGNAHGAALMDGEASFDVLNSSTNHAMTEQLLVGPTLDLSLSQDDLLHIPYDKDDLLCEEPAQVDPA